MRTFRVGQHTLNVERYPTLILGAGAAGMNCAVHLVEFLAARGVKNPAGAVGILTAGVGLGASRMSGSDKQTYYKMGTSRDMADSAESFARSLTAAGCVHRDLALAEACGSLREFYHLVQAGVPFPHDALGGYVGYKTDHDPLQRATSAGPKTSLFMSRCLQAQAERYGIRIFDHQEAAKLITVGRGPGRRIAAVLTLDRRKARERRLTFNLFCCDTLVLAAGGPGELFKTSVYPKGQTSIHGLAFEAGLVAENVTESQFGLASTKFRWNVSGTYMQVIPRVFSTDADGGNPREFLADFFPTMRQMATAIFLKGYQWPFDPQRIIDHQSSLIDLLVFGETSRGRRVFLDFRRNPRGRRGMKKFNLGDLEAEAADYLVAAGARQPTPLGRLKQMNPLAIDLFREHGIDLDREPLEIAVCAQHNNGGFAINAWWESTLHRTFVIGEMAGSHGVKRPGGAALNAGQVGGLRAAEYIANVYAADPAADAVAASRRQAESFITTFARQLEKPTGLNPLAALREIQARMSAAAGHVRRLEASHQALGEALALWARIKAQGFYARTSAEILAATQARHLALTSVAYLVAVVDLLNRGSGSRGSHLVLADNGVLGHPKVFDPQTGRPLRFKPENKALRRKIQQIALNPKARALFACRMIPPRAADKPPASFEVAWNDYRRGKIFQ
jgi:succinate dehydrogenase/fumarate reductase flavoprotein subunit